ncbi:MAG TPA: hypothetical protein VFG07_05660 [Thermoplasmata archaeon]|nr:hypothetical protein [Thermoplasmata archaeon]
MFPAIESSASVPADIVLGAEIGIGVALVVGMLLVRRGHVRWHALLQSSLVLVNLPIVLIWMVPSYLAHILPDLAEEGLQPYYLVPTLMLMVGALAEGLGIFVLLVAGTNVVPERLRFRRYKLWMRTVLILWWSVLLLGLSTYYVWYIAGYR